MTNPLSINPNDRVRIKLTESGKRMIVAHIDRFNESLRARSPNILFRSKVPEWDADGWLTDQFHSLMRYFDGTWSAGHHLPFTEMEKLP